MKQAIGSTLSALCLVAAASTVLHAQGPAVSPSTPAPAAPAAPAAVQAAPNRPATPAGTTIVERVLVRVNGEIFTQSQLTRRQIDVVREMEGVTDANLEERIASITPELLVKAVDDLLLVQHARELGFTFSQEQFNSAIENIKKQNKLDDAGLKAALEQENLTLEELRQRFEQEYLIQAVQQREIGPSMTITLEEQRQYYARNQAEFMTPLTVTLRELLIGVATQTQNGKDVFSVGEEAEARAKIEDIRKRALAGEDFVALVNSTSESATKATGGLIGPVNVDDLSPALKELVAKLEPGAISEPIRVQRGFQLFKLEARAVPERRPFDQVRSNIENAIRNERIGPETEKMLARLRTPAVIEWKDDTLRQLYEKQVAQAPARTEK
jgi:peptidyl-prolyl cis-trans isomerase SurA